MFILHILSISRVCRSLKYPFLSLPFGWFLFPQITLHVHSLDKKCRCENPIKHLTALLYVTLEESANEKMCSEFCVSCSTLSPDQIARSKGKSEMSRSRSITIGRFPSIILL